MGTIPLSSGIQTSTRTKSRISTVFQIAAGACAGVLLLLLSGFSQALTINDAFPILGICISLGATIALAFTSFKWILSAISIDVVLLVGLFIGFLVGNDGMPLFMDFASIVKLGVHGSTTAAMLSASVSVLFLARKMNRNIAKKRDWDE